MSFIETDYGLVRKDAITGLIRVREAYPWNGKTHYNIEIHLQGTTVCLKYDSEFERKEKFDRIANELKKED